MDGAALGAGRLLGTLADPQELAGEFLRANFPLGEPGFWGANNMVKTVNVQLGTTKTITVTAQVDVPLLFMRIIGRSKGTVSATATATRRDARLMLVIDRSGSMNTSNGSGGTVIGDAVNYAAAFAQKFTNGVDELGLVVFDGSGVVGYPTLRPWDSTVSATATGGPNTSFNDGTTGDMVHQIKAITAGSGTGMADALWIAYIELQKAHLRDLAANGVDQRLNSIILMTDGAPSAVSLYFNNPSDNVVKSSSSCTYKTSTTQKMIAWMAVPGPPFNGQSPQGVYLLASILVPPTPRTGG